MNELLFRMNAVKTAEDKKYVLMNAPKDKLEEIAPAQEWLDRMRECFERALQAAEEGRWIAWEGHMLQAKNVANVMRKAQEDKEIPGQMSMEMD